NVSTFERVAVVGANLAVNLDPSHFFWQSIDPLAAVARLGDRIGFAHGKDTVLEPDRVVLDGVLDRTAWRYATVGHGHAVDWWRSCRRVARRREALRRGARAPRLRPARPGRGLSRHARPVRVRQDNCPAYPRGARAAGRRPRAARRPRRHAAAAARSGRGDGLP